MSFKEDGRYGSHIEIPQEEIVANRLEFFGSGAVLVSGNRPYEGPRVAIMSPGGNSFRDVSSWPGASKAPQLDHMVRGGDGRIYFLPPGKESVYVIDASGGSQLAFELAPMPRDPRLIDLKAAGPRLAVTYYEELEHKARFWMAVYNAALGERLALYGPASGLPLCYSYEDGRDLFTIVTGKDLITLSPQ